jgi:hypothetical protein
MAIIGTVTTTRRYADAPTGGILLAGRAPPPVPSARIRLTRYDISADGANLITQLLGPRQAWILAKEPGTVTVGERDVRAGDSVVAAIAFDGVIEATAAGQDAVVDVLEIRSPDPRGFVACWSASSMTASSATSRVRRATAVRMSASMSIISSEELPDIVCGGILRSSVCRRRRGTVGLESRRRWRFVGQDPPMKGCCWASVARILEGRRGLRRRDDSTTSRRQR